MTTSIRQPRTSSPSGLLAALKDPTTRRQAIRYGIVGISVNALALVAFSILVTGGMYHHKAATLVFVVAMSASYTVNRSWSFEFRGSVRRSMASYAFIYFCAWGLNLAVLWVGIDLLGIHHTAVQRQRSSAWHACCSLPNAIGSLSPIHPLQRSHPFDSSRAQSRLLHRPSPL